MGKAKSCKRKRGPTNANGWERETESMMILEGKPKKTTTGYQQWGVKGWSSSKKRTSISKKRKEKKLKDGDGRAGKGLQAASKGGGTD